MHAFFSLLYSCSFYIEYDLVPHQDGYAFSLLGKSWLLAMNLNVHIDFPSVSQGSLLKARKLTLQKLFQLDNDST